MKRMVAAILILLASCATDYAKKLNMISLGMTKAQVISVMGEPDTTRAAENVEFLVYSLREEPDDVKKAACGGLGILTLGVIYAADNSCLGAANDYFVRIEGGSVTSYGKIGDFGSTQIPEANINIRSGD